MPMFRSALAGLIACALASSASLAQTAVEPVPLPSPPAAATAAPPAPPADAHSAMFAEKGLSGVIAALEGEEEAAARFALGGAHFLRGIERTGQAMARYNMDPISWLPGMRMDVAPSGSSATITHDAFRAILEGLVDDMKAADAALAPIGEADVALTLDLRDLWFDYDEDGARAVGESVLATAGPLFFWPEAEGGAPFIVRFDSADVAWLRAYANLLAGIGELVLAQEFKVAWALVEKATRLSDPYAAYGFDATLDQLTVALTALRGQPDRARMAASLAHLEAMIAHNRIAWRRIAAETDNVAEWIPNPRQVSALGGATVPAEVAAGWGAILDDIDGLLKGTRLAPHWRLNKGINIRRVFTEPRPFDALLWIQGAGALPYLEDGPIVTGRSFMAFERMVSGDAITYALWFN